MQDKYLRLENAIPRKHAKNEIPVWKHRGIVHVWFRIDFSAHGDRESSVQTENVRYTTIDRKAHLTADTIEH